MKTPDTLRTLPKQSRQSRATTKSGERDQINLSKSAFARLLDSIFYPNPDDSGSPRGPFGPFGPGGPVSRLLWAALNPQPLPPGPDPYSDLAWVALNPQPLPPAPDPYRAAFAARAVIIRAATQADFVELLGNRGSENGIIVVGGKVNDIVDEWCGTPVPGHHGPGPHFVSLFAAGAQFQQAADSMRNSALGSVFASAATKLFKTAMSQMESQR
jgi:hypothetical protein